MAAPTVLRPTTRTPCGSPSGDLVDGGRGQVVLRPGVRPVSSGRVLAPPGGKIAAALAAAGAGVSGGVSPGGPGPVKGPRSGGAGVVGPGIPGGGSGTVSPPGRVVTPPTGFSGRCTGLGTLTWSAPQALGAFTFNAGAVPPAVPTTFDCAFQNARWVVRRDDGGVVVVYSDAAALVAHLILPDGGVLISRLDPLTDFAGLFGMTPSPLGSSLRNACVATDGETFYIAAELVNAFASVSDLVVLRLDWSRRRRPGWSLLARTSGLEGCGLPSIVWDALGREVVVAFSARALGAPAVATNIYVWSGARDAAWSASPSLVESADAVGTQTRSKDMPSIAVSRERRLVAWRTTLSPVVNGDPQYGVAASTLRRFGRRWAIWERANLAGLPGETTDASDPCALVLPNGTMLVSYWRKETKTRPPLPEIRVSARPAMAAGWTMSGPLAPASPPSGVAYHFFGHLEHDDCRVIGIWEGRRDGLRDTTENGAFVSGSRGRGKWAVPSDTGYFEVPNTGQTAAPPNDALFPGFCTGGGLIHLVWLQNDLNTPVATLYYAIGVLA